jgi:hypothetical protein
MTANLVRNRSEDRGGISGTSTEILAYVADLVASGRIVFPIDRLRRIRVV